MIKSVSRLNAMRAKVSSFEHFQKFGSRSVGRIERAVFLIFGFVSAQSRGFLNPLLRRSLAKNPKILAPNGFRIFSNALLRFTGCLGLGIVLLTSVAATSPANTQSPEEQYIRIMGIIDRADALRTAGQTDAAHAKYLEAEKALLMFKSANPLFFPKTVAYRLKEVTDRADTRPAVPEMTNAPKMNLEAQPPAAKSNVKLLEAGAEPRKVLRYHVKPGDKQSAIMTWKLKMDMPMPAAAPGGAAPAVPSIPEISIPVDYAVQSIAANGDVTYTATMGEATLAQDTNTPPEVLQQMQTAFAGIKGVSSTWVKTSRGATKRLAAKPTATTNPQVRQMLDQFSESADIMNVELPEEAVGVGAKWESKNTTKVQTATVGQTGTFELASMDGDKLGTKFDVTFDATNTGGKAAAAGAQFNGTASGTVNVDLTKLVGSSAKLNMHMEAPMGQGQAMKMDINMGIDSQ